MTDTVVFTTDSTCASEHAHALTNAVSRPGSKNLVVVRPGSKFGASATRDVVFDTIDAATIDAARYERIFAIPARPGDRAHVYHQEVANIRVTGYRHHPAITAELC